MAPTATQIQWQGNTPNWAMARLWLRGCPEPAFVWASQGELDQLGELVLPNGDVELVWNLGAEIRAVGPRGTAPLPQLSISGPCLDAFDLRHPTVHRTVGVRLPPEVAYRVLAVPPGGFRAVLDLNDVWSSAEIDRLAEQLGLHGGVEPTPDGLVRGLLAWLRIRANSGPFLDGRTAAVLRGLRAGTTVGDVAAAVELSPAQLTRVVKNCVGVTAKRFARIEQLGRACEAIASGLSLSEVAHDAGYTDQSHMTRSFAALCGITPGRFANSHYPSAATIRLD